MHMKTWKLLSCVLLALTVVATSCNKPGPNKGGSSSSLALTINDGKTSIAADGRDAATFTVVLTREDGSTMDVTTTASFTANDTPFEGYKFTTKTAGEYTIVATYEGMTSNAVRVTASSLSLSVDPESIAANGQGTATFTVTYEDRDVTADATITNVTTGEMYKKGANTFTSPNYTGEFQFTAEYNNLKSNAITVKVVAAEPAALRLIPSVGRVNAGETVTFKVENNGTDVTKDAKIKVVDGDYIENATYTMGEGTVKFVAEYEGNTSAEVCVSTKDFLKNILVFKFTNVDCPNCPALADALEIASEVLPIVEVAVHYTRTTPTPDPMVKDENLFADFRAQGLVGPTGVQLPNAFGDLFEVNFVGRMTSAEVINYLKPLSLRQTYAGLSAEVKAEGTTVTATANVTSSSATRDFYLGAMLVENGIRYAQSGSNMGDNYTHNHTYREMGAGNLYGKSLGVLAVNQQVTETFTFDASKYNVDNCHVVFYVLYKDGDKYVATNAIDVPMNDSVGYEFVD